MIYIATHKEFANPSQNGYIPIQVGTQGKQTLGYLQDNIGQNISNKNENFFLTKL